MSKLFVVCGHGAGDPGAVGNGFNEAERVRTLAARMKAIGGDAVTIGATSVNWFRSKRFSTYSFPRGVPVLELHMDAASASARGGHVIIHKRFEADSYDIALARFIGEHFPGRSKSIVKRDNLYNLNKAASRGINYRLLEVCFITNKADITKFNADIDAVARGILAAFGIGSKVQVPAPETAQPPIIEQEEEESMVAIYYWDGKDSKGKPAIEGMMIDTSSGFITTWNGAGVEYMTAMATAARAGAPAKISLSHANKIISDLEKFRAGK